MIVFILVCGPLLHAQTQADPATLVDAAGTVTQPDLSLDPLAVTIGQGDDVTFNITLPFAYSFFGDAASTLATVSSNGFIGSTAISSSDRFNDCPGPQDGNGGAGHMSVLHGDRDLESGSPSTLYQRDYSAGDADHPGHPTAGTSLDVTIVQWNNAQDWPGTFAPASTDLFTFSVALYEDGSAAYLYGPDIDNSDPFSGTTVGIQGPSGDATFLNCNTAGQFTSDTYFLAAAPVCTEPITLLNCPIIQSLTFNTSCPLADYPSLSDYTGLVQFDNPCVAPPSFSQSPAAGTDMATLAGAPFNNGDVIPVTVTLTDADDNTYDCVINVEINHSTEVSVVCPTNPEPIIISTDCENALVPNVTGNIAPFSFCSDGYTVTQSPAAGDLISATVAVATGNVLPITVTVEDDQGFSAFCTVIYSLVVDQPFSLSACPTDIITTTDATTCGAAVTWTAPTVTEACGNAVTMTASHTSGETFPVGTTQVTLKYSDAAGNSQECFFDVIVSDDDDPTIDSCPGDITVTTDGDDCTANVIYTLPTFSDNCGIVSVSLANGQASETDFPVGNTSVQWVATDAAGNSTTCFFDVIVTDATAPVALNCPAGLELNFNADCNDANTPGLPDVTAIPSFTDACGVVTLTQSPVAGTVINTLTPVPFVDGATFDVTVTATDDAGNTTDCIVTVTLNDNIGPHIACPGDQTVLTSEEGDGSCVISLPDFTGLATAGVLCGTEQATVTQSPVAGSTYTNGDVITVTLTATDAASNSESCEFEVTFVDDTAPVLGAGVCADPAPFTLAPGDCIASITLTPPVSEDNCDADPTEFGVRSDGGDDLTAANGYTGDFSPCETEVTWYSTDADGNTSDALCTVTVSVIEPINEQNQPNAVCIGIDDLGLNDEGLAYVNGMDVAGTSSDACTDDITIEVAKSTALGFPLPGEVFMDELTYDCSELGLNYVCVRVTDCSGNEAFCTSPVTVNERRFPYIACPGDITIECDVDNDGDPLLFAGTPPAFPTPNYPQANTPVDLAVFQAWVAAGYGMGNPSPGQDAATGITGVPLAYDNCGATIEYTNEYFYFDGATRVGPVSYISDLPINDPHECEHHNYEIERTFVVTDNFGRTAECTQLIVVQDTTDPIIDANGVADATIACDDPAALAAALAPMPIAEDNCWLASFELIQDNSDAPARLFPTETSAGGECIRFRIVREWEAIDACGNTSNLVQTIDLIDTVAPDISVTLDGTTYTGVGPHVITGLATDPGHCDASLMFTWEGSDNCDELFLENYGFIFNGAPLNLDLVLLNDTYEFTRVFEKGQTFVEVSATDACGNATIVLFDITVEDMEAPSFIDCTEDTFTFLTSDADVPVNNEDLDDCGARVQLQIPAYNDNCPLVMGAMSGAIEMKIDLDPTSAATPISPNFINFSANFVDVTADANNIKSGVLPVGTHTVRFTMTDAAGNMAADTCSYTVVVTDDQAPELACQLLSDVILVDGDGTADCTASYIDGKLGGNFGLITNIIPVMSDNCGYTATYTLSGATTGTGTFTYVAGSIFPPAAPSAPGLTFDLNVGNTSINYTVVDAAGNTIQCSTSVTVFDNIDPTITCPADIVASTDAGVCTYTADVTPTVDDNCAVDYVRYVMTGATAASGDIALADLPGALAAFDFEVGVTTVNYRVYDVQGLSSACSYTVTITDDEDPIAACPGNYVVGTSGAIYENGETGASMAVGSLTSAVPTGDCETTIDGLNVVTTDNCCVSSVQYQIANADGSIFQDWIAVANDPQVVDAELDLDLSAQVFPKGDYTVNIRTWDCYMNEGVCSFDVSIIDDEKPAFTDCPTDKVANAPSGACVQTVFWTVPKDANVIDNCLADCGVELIEGPYFSADADQDTLDIDTTVEAGDVQSNGNTSALFSGGTTYVKYFVTDAAGNTEWCIFSVTVNDITAPTADNMSPAAELNFNVDCESGAPVVPDYIALAGFQDACLLTYAQAPAAGSDLTDLFPLPYVDGQTATVTITATDIGGNTVVATVTVTLNDNVGPSIACPADQIVGSSENGDGACIYTLPDFRDLATAGVLCLNEAATVTQSPAPGTEYINAAGTSIDVTLTAADGAIPANTESCTFSISFVDDSAPMLAIGETCDDPAETLLAPGACTAVLTLTPPAIADNCDADLIIVGTRNDGGESLTEENGYTGTFSPCETEVTWSAIDDALNEATDLCTITVTVTEADSELNQPNALCAQITVGLNDEGVVTVSTDDLDAGSDDACTDDLTFAIARADAAGQVLPGEVESAEITFTCDDLGLNYICLKVTDCSGNENACTALVTVEDKKDPRIACPADITIECDVDNNGDPLLFDPAIGLPAHATDYPAANVPTDVTLYNLWLSNTTIAMQGQNAAEGITGVPLAFDNCGATVSYVNNYFYFNQAGVRVPAANYESTLPINDPHECAHHNYDIERVFTIVDGGGRTAECTQLIQVRDTEAPVISTNGVADAVLECSDDAGIAAALAPVPSADDNCYLSSFELIFDNSGAPEVLDCAATGFTARITRTWEAIDACGNTETLTQIIDLQDTTAPSLTVSVAGSSFSTSAGNSVTIGTDDAVCNAEVFFEVALDDNCDEDLFDQYTISVGGTPVPLNATGDFTLVLEKGSNLVSVLVADDCDNITIVEIDVIIEDDEAPAFEDCTEETYTFFTSDADVPTGEVNVTDCAASVQIQVPAYQDNCPLVMGAMSGSIEMIITVDPSSASAVAGNLAQYVGTWVDVTADDNNVIGGTLPVGVHTVEFRMTDAAGNVSDICSYTLDVIDDQNPDLTCPGNMSAVLSNDEFGTDDCEWNIVNGLNLGTDIIPVIGDNCEYTFDLELSGATSASLTDVMIPEDLDFDLAVGNTSFVYTATDAEGNTTQCSFSITVIDDIDPEITCPSFPTALVAEAGVCYTTQDIAPSVSDNCDGGAVSYVISGATALSGEIAVGDLPAELATTDINVGITFINYTYTDAEGNSISCSFQIEVLDEELPVVDCPSAITIGTSGTVDPTDAIDYDASGDCETTVAGLVFDATDNCSIASVQYRVIDDADGGLVIDWTVIANSPLPADGDMTLDLSAISFDKGDYTIDFRAWDNSMNEGLCSTDLIVVDDEKPAFTDCPSDFLVNTMVDACGQNVEWTQPLQDNVVDNCLDASGVEDIQGPFISFDADEDYEDIDAETPAINTASANAFAQFPVGTRYVKYSVTDDAGNTEWCIFEVTVIDNIPPVITGLPNSDEFIVNVDLDCDSTLTLDSYTNQVLFSDNCGDFDVTQVVVGTFVDGDVVVDGQEIDLTIVATDDAGLTAEYTITLIINDNVGPTIACPANQMIAASTPGALNSDCMVILPDYTTMATASVQCGNEEPTVSQSPAPGTVSSSMMFPMIVTLTATDVSGNETACSFMVGYSDDVAPTLVECGADPAAGLTAIGGCMASVTLTPPTVEDCAIVPPFVYGISSSGAILNASNGYTANFPACESTVTWYAVDMAGNSAEVCENNVTVFEPLNEANEPTAACQNGIVLGLKNDGTVTLYAETYGQNSFDNCANSTLEYGIHIVEAGVADPVLFTELVFDCSQVGTQTICLVVTDCSGNQDLCFSTVTIQDKRDPVLICPADITIACHTDNGGVPATGAENAVMTPFSQVDFDAYDNTTGQDAENGITGFAQGWDNCDATVTYTDASTQGTDMTECDFYNYTVTRTFVITDLYGNDTDFDGNDCQQVITVKDTIAPFFSEAADELDAFINCDDPNMGGRMALAMALEPTPNDLCYVEMTELAPQTIDLVDCTVRAGVDNIFQQIIRTWEAVDACGNTTLYTQTISIFDTTAPAIQCPIATAPSTFFTSSGDSPSDCLAAVSIFATASDCQDLDLSYEVKDLTTGSAVVYSGPVIQFTAQIPPGQYCIEFTATDRCGNESSCLSFFNVIDDSVPTLDCAGLPDDDADDSNGYAVALDTDLDMCSAEFTWATPLIGDNCGADLYVDLGLGDGPEISAPGTTTAVFPTGTTTVSYYAEDESGQLSAMCSFDVTVTDNIAPSIDCPTDAAITLLTSSDGFANYDCDVNYNWKSPEADDNCEVVSYMIQIGSDAPMATFFDQSFDYQFPLGTTDVVYTATDAAGNSTTCTLSITVEDDEEPVTLCQDATIELDEAGMATLDASQVDGGSYDNCDLSLSVSPDAFTCDALGDNTVTLTVSDAAGNSFFCTATVTVEDNIDPTIESCDDRSADAADGSCEYEVTGTDWDPIALDNCAATLVNDYTGTATLDGASFSTGTTTVNWTATDAAGNTATCSHTVFISNADLTAVCQSYINTNTLSLGDDGTLTLTAADFDGGSGEACDDLSLGMSIDGGQSFVTANTFTCDDITLDGPMNVFLQVTDNATGESDVCLAQLSLVDGPVFVDFGDCPDDITVPATIGQCGATVSVPLPVVTGACPVIGVRVNGDAYVVTDSDPSFFLEIGTHLVEFAINNGSNDAGTVLGTGGNICAVTVIVEAGPGSELGCTDPAASNYDPAASCDDGSCILAPVACVTVDDLPYSEDFEGTTGAWTQEISGDDLDWLLNSGATATEGTGPTAASSGEQYLYIESSYPNYPAKDAIINSPCFDLLETSQTNFAFAYNMSGEGVGTLALEVTVDGAEWETVWTQSGDQGTEWIAEDVDLSDYEDEMITVRFHGETTNSYNGDIAIDQFGFAAENAGPDCEGDLNGDGSVDVADFIEFNSAYGSECAGCAADFNGDGVVNINDFIIFNSVFGNDCGAQTAIFDPSKDLAAEALALDNVVIDPEIKKILEDMSELSFTVFPNPNAGDAVSLYVEDFASADATVTIQVKDVAGRMLSNQTVFGSEAGFVHHINFDRQLSAGVYMVVVDTAGKTKTKRFVVE